MKHEKEKKIKYKPSASFLYFLNSSVKEIKEILNLNDYDVIFDFVDRVKPYQHLPTTDSGYTFEMELDSTYMCIELKVPHIAQEKFNKGHGLLLREALCHEFCHVITYNVFDSPTKKRSKRELIDLDENLTQRFAIIVAKLLKGR